MAHECPVCGQACYCDQEDLWQEAPDDCACDHGRLVCPHCGEWVDECTCLLEDGGGATQ
jgi:uncharacterized protein YbaR (Trm112 family)